MKHTPVAQSSPMLPKTIACTFTAPREAAGFADFDRDGVLDAFGQRTCAFCTSNHVLWKGLP